MESGSKVNRALEHVLRTVVATCAAAHIIHEEQGLCLPEEPCSYCQIMTATYAAVADYWERPNADSTDDAATGSVLTTPNTP